MKGFGFPIPTLEKHMTSFLAKNVGSPDRIFRVLLGVGLLALAFVGPKTPWGYIGIIPILTAVFSFCPAYAVFGFSTCRTKPA